MPFLTMLAPKQSLVNDLSNKRFIGLFFRYVTVEAMILSLPQPTLTKAFFKHPLSKWVLKIDPPLPLYNFMLRKIRD